MFVRVRARKLAGIMNSGGTLIGEAVKELQEETGLVLQGLRSIGELAPSPGRSTERVQMLRGDVTLSDDKVTELLAKEHGLAAEGEFIRVVLLPRETGAILATGDPKLVFGRLHDVSGV